MDDLFQLTIYFRMGERIALTAIIVLLSLIVTVGFWKSLQRVEFDATQKTGLGGNVVLATPVFVLLALVGYAWVSLQFPITFSTVPTTKDGIQMAGQPASSSEFTGIVELLPDPDTDFARLEARSNLHSLNCLISQSGIMAPRMEDDLTAIRLDLFSPLWDPQWGDFAAFQDWAFARSTVAPAPGAQAAYDDTGLTCLPQ